MSAAPRDPIAFVEACYDLASSDTEWLQNIADHARPLLSAKALLAYHVDTDERGLHIRNPVQSGDADGDIAARIASLADLLERHADGNLRVFGQMQAKLLEKALVAGLADPVDRMLLSEKQTYGPRWLYTLGVPGVRDLLFMINHHIDANGATFLVGSLSERGQLRHSERTMLQRLGAHLKAGLRLRRRMPSHLRSVTVSEDDAVLDGATGRLVHAEGEARSLEARQSLEQNARQVDRARAHGGRNEDALSVWQGLIDGRWSLVERFDADGRRYILAHKNPEAVTDPRGLAPLEARITGLAVRGYSDKLIAYHLGIAEGTVSSHLARSMRKLGVANRIELVRVLGNSFSLRQKDLDA